ncbi:hypothetical protein [Moorena producens]|nr:hypothetical protein [Moorena producens]
MQSASGGNHASCSWGEPPQVGTGSRSSQAPLASSGEVTSPRP